MTWCSRVDLLEVARGSLMESGQAAGRQVRDSGVQGKQGLLS